MGAATKVGMFLAFGLLALGGVNAVADAGGKSMAYKKSNPLRCQTRGGAAADTRCRVH